MATIKLNDLAYFLVFSGSKTRSSGAWASNMGHVIHQNDRLVKAYLDRKKKLDKNNFGYHGNHKTGRFCLFLSIFGLPHQGCGGGGDWQESCNTPKWPSSQGLSGPQENVDKKPFRYHGNTKTGRFCRFFSIFVAPTFVQLNVNSKLLVATPALCL